MNGIKKNNIIEQKCFEFALDIIELYKKLQEKREYIISKQVLRSGTGIGANTAEAQAAQSRKDFLSKMSIASKEARETRYWLCLLDRSKMADLDYSPYLRDIDQLIRILTSIVKTASKKC